MLWFDTNYSGKYVHGSLVNNQLQSSLPLALQQVPRLVLDYGDPKTPRTKNNRIPIQEYHFVTNGAQPTCWDLYFIRFERDMKVRFAILPRGIFDRWGAPMIHLEAVQRLNWKYLAALDANTLRWDLRLALEGFFGIEHFPHCTIETFLPIFTNPRQSREGRKERMLKSNTETARVASLIAQSEHASAENQIKSTVDKGSSRRQRKKAASLLVDVSNAP